jgi:peptidoglycan/LPS O-acetylase OafA/YrhL
MQPATRHIGYKRFFTNLDALRFFAFLAVFVTHVVTIASGVVLANPFHQRLLHVTHLGFLGVDFFFVLSSFLITWIALEEHGHTGGFAMRPFWIRRTLRIWPLYFAVVMAAYAAVWWVGPRSVTPHPVWFATFTANFYMSEHGHEFLLALGVLWSISVEEQFYFAWAPVLKWLKRHLPGLCAVLIAISLASCVYLRDEKLYPCNFTSVFLQHFAVGALLAWYGYTRPEWFRRVEHLSRRSILLGYAGGLALLAAYRHAIGNTLAVIPLRFAIVLFFGFVIFEQSFGRNSLLKLGGWNPLDYMGRISYGLYVYHGVALSATIYLTAPYGAGHTLLEAVVLYPLAIFVATTTLAIVSYELYEKPFLRLKSCFYR